MAEIGSPSIDPLLDQIETTDDPKIRVATSVVRKQRPILSRDRLDHIERTSTLG